jgi:hypothetical protein
MKTLELEPAYEAARLWTVHPVSHPPAGWAQMVRVGLAAWMRARQRMDASQPQASFPKKSDCSPLLTIVAAMIVEVCQ